LNDVASDCENEINTQAAVVTVDDVDGLATRR